MVSPRLALKQNGRIDEALAAFDATLAHSPSDYTALIGRLILLELMQHADMILNTAEIALGHWPDDVDFLLAKSNALNDLNRRDEALAAADRGLSIAQMTSISCLPSPTRSMV